MSSSNNIGSQEFELNEEKAYEGLDGTYPYCKYRMQEVIKILKKANCKNILDLGCTNGTVLRNWINQGGKGIGIDINEHYINQGKEKFKKDGLDENLLKVRDAKNLSIFKDNSFDAVIALGLHLFFSKDEQEKSFKDIYRVLKKDGVFITGHLNLINNFNTFNSYTIKAWEEMIEEKYPAGLVDKNIIENIASLIKNDKYPKLSETKKRYDNPLTINKEFKKVNFEVIDKFFYFRFAYPPLLKNNTQNYIEICKELDQFAKRDWSALLTSHAFSCVAVKRICSSKIKDKLIDENSVKLEMT